MSKTSRKKVGKNTGKTTKAGRPIFETDEGEERSEYSATIRLDNGKYINIPSIHNGMYYKENELKEAVEDNRMIPTSEHDSLEEAIEAAKKRSKTLKQGGLLKAHQGTIVNGQIVYPQTSQAPSDPNPIANPFLTDPNTIPPQKKIGSGIMTESVTKQPDPLEDYAKETETFTPLVDPAVDFVKNDTSGLHGSQPVKSIDLSTVSTPFQGGKTFPQLTEDQKSAIGIGYAPDGTPYGNVPKGLTTQPAEQKPQYTSLKEFLGGKTNTLQDYLDQNNRAKLVQQFSKDFNLDQKGRNIAMPMIEKMESIKAKYEPKLLELQFKLENNQIDPKEAQNQMNTVYALQMAEQQQVGKNNASLSQDIAMQQSNLQKQFEDAFFKQYKPVGQGNTVSKPMAFNEGGTVMEKQMEMNFGETPISKLAEGGMKDDGGEKDPVSGNDVPSGSMAKEVRDDVPAMVSEGEFIFPADVTRFIGLNNLMEMRQDAKMGLKKMEAMGQLGNPEDAELPDDIPFDAADIIIMNNEEELEVDKKNEGGIIGFQTGTADAGNQANQYYNIQEEGRKQYARKYVIYKNDAGQTIRVLSTANGSAIDTVPAGYKMVLDKDGLPATELPDMPEQKKPEIEQPSVQQKDDDNDTTDPMEHIRRGRESAKITADRLGMDVDEYINLPIKTRFNLLSEELNVMRGGTLDTEKRDSILAGAEGDGIFGGSLIGGVFDMIGSVFDKDNDGSMWTSTDKDGYQRNIFGVVLNPDDPIDVSKMGILKGGRWTGAATKKKSKDKDSDGSGSLDQNLNSTSSKFSIDGKKQSVQAKKHDSYKGVTKSDPYASKAAQFKRAEDNESKRQEKERKERTESFRAKEKNRMQGSNTKSRAGSGTGQRGTNEYEDDTGAAMINKGTLVTKRSTTKKPTTQRKTLVTKRS